MNKNNFLNELHGPISKKIIIAKKVGSNNSGEETDKTREIGTQVELNKNIELKKLSRRIKYKIYSRKYRDKLI